MDESFEMCFLGGTMMSYDMSGSAVVSVFCTLTGVPKQSSP